MEVVQTLAMLGVVGRSLSWLLAIPKESAKALLVLLYAHIDEGVQRVDLFLVLEAAASCREYKFGTSAKVYSRGDSDMLQGGQRGQTGQRMSAQNSSHMDLEGDQSPVAIM